MDCNSTKSEFLHMKVKLVEVSEVRMGYTFRSRLEPEMDGDVAVIQMKDIDDSNLLHPEGLARIRMPELKDRHLVQEGDLMFRSRGVTNTAALVAGNLGRSVLAAPMMLIRPDTKRVQAAYLLWFINQPSIQKILSAQAAGTAVKMISKAALEQLEVSAPPLKTQKRIVEIWYLATLEAQLATKLMERRRVLIDGALMKRARETAA
jgi:hypothetical protein